MAPSELLQSREEGVHAPSDPVKRATHDVLRLIFGPEAARSFAVRLWDGTVERPAGDGALPFTIVLRHPAALRRMFLPPSELSLAKAYLRGDFDIEGDVEAATRLADVISGHIRTPTALARLISRLRALPADGGDPAPALRYASRLETFGRRHDPRRDAAAIRFHYDVGNDFYKLWLDERMVYSCAYFATADADLDSAQRAKLDRICRKLRLQAGERLLDIGCGWGGLIMHAAGHYGVHALGITVSEAQAELARARIAEAGLSDRCRVEVRDYRDLPDDTVFDKVVSVGMFEHVGRQNLPGYFAQVARVLKAPGLFLNSGIVASAAPQFRKSYALLARTLWKRGQFIDRYVFPDGDLVPLGDVIRDAAEASLETRDVESLREHYALTLRHWVRRLERRRGDAVRLVGEAAYRVWRLYMAASAHAFTAGRISIVQVLFTKPDGYGRSGLPLTRSG